MTPFDDSDAPVETVQSIISEPLRTAIGAAPRDVFSVIVELSESYPGGYAPARQRFEALANADLSAAQAGDISIDREDEGSSPYVFARITGVALKNLVKADRTSAPSRAERAIFHVFSDRKGRVCINKSAATVKADAAQRVFSASGEGIVWAVLDTGIDAAHPHFEKYRNLDLEPPLEHVDLLTSGVGDALRDPNGHGTHVAGIIAGSLGEVGGTAPIVVSRELDEEGRAVYSVERKTETYSGMAPRAKLVSMRVIAGDGSGDERAILKALRLILRWNQGGDRPRVHGVNISIGIPYTGYEACGQTPICKEVDRLSRSGVVVVVAAGNSGYGLARLGGNVYTRAGLSLTIQDPGNAEGAITVGATDRERPRVAGIASFSSKGPTADGRRKPDLVAPGSGIYSCAAGQLKAKILAEMTAENFPFDTVLPEREIHYVARDGTSMAAPHVSGAVAAFLSVRPAFIGAADKVKDIFRQTAADLGRERSFQGAGLIDAFAALKSVP